MDIPEKKPRAPLGLGLPSTRWEWLDFTLVALFLLYVTGALLVPVLRDSLTWRYSHDTPLMMYMAFIMERFGFVPYRDFFDMNMLGSYLSYQMLGRWFGFDDPGVRMADLAVLATLMSVTLLMLWRLGLRIMWAAPVLFALVYMREGITMTLQREFLALVPISLGVAFATALPWVTPPWRALLAGFAFGIAATFKPHSLIGLPFVVLYLAEEETVDTPGWRAKCNAIFWLAIQAGLGMALPLFAFLGYLVYNGALAGFIDLTTGYLPLYVYMTRTAMFIDPSERTAYLIDEFFKMGGKWLFLVMGFTGLCMGMFNTALNPAQRRITALLGSLTVAYMIYPVFSGQFWYYHFLPMMYFLCVGACLVFGSVGAGASWQQQWLPRAFVLIILISLFQPYQGYAPLHAPAHSVPKDGRPDAVAAFLKERLQPGDTVQPLDLTGGMIHGMLQAEARIATPFIYYFHFLHSINTEYIQNLRKRFLTDLAAAKPRFILKRHPAKGAFVTGVNTTKEFKEVDDFIAKYYKPAKKDPGYIIYERIPEGGPPNAAP